MRSAGRGLAQKRNGEESVKSYDFDAYRKEKTNAAESARNPKRALVKRGSCGTRVHRRWAGCGPGASAEKLKGGGAASLYLCINLSQEGGGGRFSVKLFAAKPSRKGCIFDPPLRPPSGVSWGGKKFLGPSTGKTRSGALGRGRLCSGRRGRIVG